MKKTLQEALKTAMKAKDRDALDAIRAILTELQYVEMNKDAAEITEEDFFGIFKREIKKRHEEIEFAEKANRPEQIVSLKKQITLIESYLPQSPSESEIESIVTNLKAETPGINMGGAMKVLREKYGSKVDGKVASEVCKRVLG